MDVQAAVGPESLYDGEHPGVQASHRAQALLTLADPSDPLCDASSEATTDGIQRGGVVAEADRE
jgi:hypothetical protein